jgi:ADP-heptose:LPS heptosyltransferase
VEEADDRGSFHPRERGSRASGQAPSRRGPLSGAAVLVNGSLVTTPFCLEHASPPGARLAPIGGTLGPTRVRIEEIGRAGTPRDLHIINAMGVAVGDSIVGLQALHILKRRYPGLRLHVYRSPYTPELNGLYRRVPFLTTVAELPVTLDAFSSGHVVDLADFMFRPAFARLPMIDYFLTALGLDPASVDPADKNPDWLSELRHPVLPPHPDYILFCPSASTPLRSIPPRARRELVEAVCRHWPGIVLGFGPVEHSSYRDVSPLSPNLETYLAWLRDARAVVSTDTSAVHIAAGFRRPTLAYFVSIRPSLRSAYYPTVSSVDLVHEALKGRHSSDDPGQLALLARCWDDYIGSGMAARDVEEWFGSGYGADTASKATSGMMTPTLAQEAAPRVDRPGVCRRAEDALRVSSRHGSGGRKPPGGEGPGSPA